MFFFFLVIMWFLVEGMDPPWTFLSFHPSLQGADSVPRGVPLKEAGTEDKSRIVDG